MTEKKTEMGLKQESRTYHQLLFASLVTNLAPCKPLEPTRRAVV
jgi:hypothetical protein